MENEVHEVIKAKLDQFDAGIAERLTDVTLDAIIQARCEIAIARVLGHRFHGFFSDISQEIIERVDLEPQNLGGSMSHIEYIVIRVPRPWVVRLLTFLRLFQKRWARRIAYRQAKFRVSDFDPASWNVTTERPVFLGQGETITFEIKRR